MKRSIGILVCGTALLALLASPALSQNRGKARPKVNAGEARNEAARKAAKPGAAHERLEALVGTFTGKVTAHNPEGQSMDGTATFERKWICSKRFVLETMTAELGGQQEGCAIIGYDNLKKKYTYVWVDNGTTSTLMLPGSWDSGMKSINFSGKHDDPAGGKPVRMKMSYKIIDNDHHKITQDEESGGTMYTAFEWSLERQK